MSHDPTHEGSEFYVVCTHLLGSCDPGMIGGHRPPNPDALEDWDRAGDLVCSMKPPFEHQDEELKYCCAHCLTEMGLLPAPTFD
jgi:hypothetical protein